MYWEVGKEIYKQQEEKSWSNNIVIMEKCKDDLQREFYIQMTTRYGWTKRILASFIEIQTYEKYLLNQTNFDLTIPTERRVQAKLAVKDEYTFDFAELSPEYSEHELEIQLINICFYSSCLKIIDTFDISSCVIIDAQAIAKCLMVHILTPYFL